MNSTSNKPRTFNTLPEAFGFFYKRNPELQSVDIEQCEACGKWSCSNADDELGAIVGVDPELADGCDRLCIECAEKQE